jgi:hypothetical protein
MEASEFNVRSTKVLGKIYNSYTAVEIRGLLQHFEVPLSNENTKTTLFKQLFQLERTRNITKYHRRQIQARLTSGRVHGPGPSTADSELEASEEDSTTCQVCEEDINRDDNPILRITGTCQHEPTICRECMSYSIRSQLEDKAWNRLACPLCPEMLSFEDVKNLATPEIFERLEE